LIPVGRDARKPDDHPILLKISSLSPRIRLIFAHRRAADPGLPARHPLWPGVAERAAAGVA
jgi:hypothetical protein